MADGKIYAVPSAAEDIEESHVRSVKPVFVTSGVIALLLLARLLAPVPQLGFVSDDYLLLAEDAHLPWYDSSDHLYRFLRNGMCRVMPRLFGMQPRPYHLLELAAYLCCLVLLGVFLWKQGARVIGIIGGVTLVALYPRNHPELFGFVWVQETGAAIGILAGLILWSSFREKGSRVAYLLALLSFMLGIGFKETAIVFPVLVVAVDLFHSRLDPNTVRRREFWLPYAGVALVATLFVGYVLSQRQGRVITPDPQGVYQAHSIVGAVLGMAREVMNLILPFASAFGLRDLKLIDYAGAVLILLALLLTGWWSRTLSSWMVSLVWVLATVFPPSMFARSNNADQYLFLPIIGVALAVSATLDFVAARKAWLGISVAAALVLYSVLGSWQLTEEREEWATAGRIVQEFLRQVRSLSPPGQADALVLVNSPHSNGRAPVLGSGLRGALIVAGYRRDLPGRYMPSPSFPNHLIKALKTCLADVTASGSLRILVWQDGLLKDRTGACAQRLIAQDEAQNPWQWEPIYSKFSAP
jgi:hypothetical protein